MGLLSRTGDLFYAFRFLKMLVTPFNKTKAFELGIVDKDGKVLKKSKELKTAEEKSSYTVFHRLVFNIKKLLAKVPGGSSIIARYGAALYLIKENTGMTEEEILAVLEEYLDEPIQDEIQESVFYCDGNQLLPGRYDLTEEVAIISTGELVTGSILVNEHLDPVETFSHINIYKVIHQQTGQNIYITTRNITR